MASHRGNESPMDFKWEGQGPVDPNSAFTQFASKKSKKTDPMSIFASSGPDLTVAQGSQPAFASSSPGKSSFPSFSFASPTRHAPGSPFRNPSFTTPRKPYDVEESSGAETSPRPPPVQEDTPDRKPLQPIPLNLAPKSEKRNSLSNFLGRFAPKDNRGAIKKSTTDTLERKKRRQAQAFPKKQVAVARKLSEEEEDPDYVDSENPPRKSRRKNKQQNAHEKALPPPPQSDSWLKTSLTYLQTYPDAPAILSKYLQTLFNAILLSTTLYLIYTVYATITTDISHAASDEAAAVLQEMSLCTKSYIENKCAMDTRLPALEQVCANWELCMNRDPYAVKRARTSAQMFAEVVNAFFEGLSFRGMGGLVLLVVGGWVGGNVGFGVFRRELRNGDHGHGQRGYQGHHQVALGGQWMGPQQSIQGSGQYGGAGQFGQWGNGNMTPGLGMGYPPQQVPWTPGGQQGPGQNHLEWDQSPSKSRGESRSPQKQRTMPG